MNKLLAYKPLFGNADLHWVDNVITWSKQSFLMTLGLTHCPVFGDRRQSVFIYGGDICYENQHISRLKFVRYSKYIPTGKGESGSLDSPFFNFHPPFYMISIWHSASWCDMFNISKLYPNPKGWFRNPRFTHFYFQISILGDFNLTLDSQIR